MFNRVLKCLPLCKISIKQVIIIMKQLHFYQYGVCGEVEYIKDLPNWTGEVPQQGDFVKLHFGDNREEEYVFRVLYRAIDGRKPNDVDVFVSMVKKVYVCERN